MSEIIQSGQARFFQADFGRTAEDYGRYRAGFPDELFNRLQRFGIGLQDQRVLDLGTGTGYLARSLALRGARVVGADRSVEIMRASLALDASANAKIQYVQCRAEDLCFAAGSFDVVAAGQCWHWFHRSRAAAEARRVTVAGGRLLLAHFDWIPLPGNIADVTEKLIEKHNPNWKFGGGMGIYPKWFGDAANAGYREIESFTFDEFTPYSHEAWRGRIRASAGIGASLSPEGVTRFDAELAAVLKERFPDEPMRVHHRVFAMVAVK